MRQATSKTLFYGRRRSISQSRSRAIITLLRIHQCKEKTSRGLKSKMLANNSNPLRIFTIRSSCRVSTSPKMPQQRSMLAADSRARRSRWWRSRSMLRGFQWAATKPRFFKTINWCLTRPGPIRSIIQESSQSRKKQSLRTKSMLEATRLVPRQVNHKWATQSFSIKESKSRRKFSSLSLRRI